MDNLEAALRRALEKGDIRDSAFRRRVYVAAASALQRSAERRPTVATDRLREQTEKLTAIIEAIERQLHDVQGGGILPPRLKPVPRAAADPQPRQPRMDGQPARPPAVRPARANAPSPAPTVSPAPARAAPAAPAAEPMPAVSPLQRPPPRPQGSLPETLHVEPRMVPPPPPPPPPAGGPDSADALPPAGSASPFRFARGPFATVFAGVVIAALLVMGVIWIVVSGAFVPLEQRDTAVPNPPLTLPDESFEGDPDRPVRVAPLRDAPAGFDNTFPAQEGWITLFSPVDPTSLRLVGGASASIQSDPFGAYARLVTPSIDSAIRVDVPVGTLQRLAGRVVEISLRARTDTAPSTQLSVTCDFGALGDCGRRRFNLGAAEADYLFQVQLPAGGTPTQSGSLQLTTGFGDADGTFRLISAAIRAVEG